MKEEEFHLKWSSYSGHLTQMLQDLMMNQSFTDVTLVCDDKIMLNAHKIVLSASSGFFQRIFSNVSDSKPIVYLKGIKYQEMKAILDFIYLGEANFLKERSSEFIRVAFDLELKAICQEGLKDDTLTKKENTDTKAIQYRNKVQEANIISERSNKENDIFEVEYLTEEQYERSRVFDAKFFIKNGQATKANSSAKQLENVKQAENTGEDSDDKIEGGSINAAVKGVEPLKNDEINNQNSTNLENKIEKVVHTNSKEKGVKHSCVACNVSFSNVGKLLNHCRLHHKGVPNMCNRCAYQALDKADLKKHKLEIHHYKSCSECDFIAFTAYTVDDHIIENHAGLTKKCNDCGGHIIRHQLILLMPWAVIITSNSE